MSRNYEVRIRMLEAQRKSMSSLLDRKIIELLQPRESAAVLVTLLDRAESEPIDDERSLPLPNPLPTDRSEIESIIFEDLRRSPTMREYCRAVLQIVHSETRDDLI